MGVADKPSAGVVGSRAAQQEKSKSLKELSSSVWEIDTVLVQVTTQKD